MFKRYKYPLIIILFFIFGCIFFHDVFDPLVDAPREILIPKAILEGELLYKDIFNIYGALPYYIVALVFKIFGISTSVYFSINVICALLFVFGIYFLSKQFIQKRYACICSICVMCVTIFSVLTFNFLYPYSICYTFGLCAYLYSTLFLIRFVKEDKYNFFLISSLLAGFSFACKNEFIFLPLVHLIVLFLYKRQIKNFIYFFLMFLIFPIFQIALLFLSGLKFNDLIFAIFLVIKSANVPAMIEFHKEIGMCPSILAPYFLIKMAIYWIAFCFSYFLCTKNKVLGYITFLIFIFTFDYNALPYVYSFLPCLTLLFLICNVKKIANKPSFLILILAALFSSFKCFFVLNFLIQGALVIPLYFVVWSLIFLIYKKPKAIMITFLCFLYFFYFSICIVTIKFKYNISYNNIQLKAAEVPALVMEKTISWIKLNTNKEDKIILFPECITPLLMIENKTDYMFYNLHDITIQTFGDKYIKNRILHNNIKYIVDISEFNFHPTAAYKIIKEGKYIESLFKNEFALVDKIGIFGNNIKIYKRIIP